MKKSKFSEDQIVRILKEAEAGAKVGETCRKHGISESTYYVWKNKYAGSLIPAQHADRASTLASTSTIPRPASGPANIR